MKKLVLCITSAVVFWLTTFTAFAETAGFASESDTVVSAHTPYDKKYVGIDWHTSIGETVGVPIAYKEFVLLPTLNKVNKLSEEDGSVVAFAEFDEKVSEEYSGAVVNNTLVQPTKTSVYVVNTENMNVACSRKFGEITTDISVADAFAYFGFKDGDKFKFCCADISKNLETVWEYTSENAVTPAAKIGDAVVFGTGDTLVAVKNGEFIENPVGAEISRIFAGDYAVFMSCRNGELRKLRLDEDGKTEEGSLSQVLLGAELTAPTGIDNHIYVGSADGFFVVDGLNMEITKKFEELKNSSPPFVTVGNGVRAYIAVPHSDSSGDSWYLYSVLDSDDVQSASEIIKILDYTNGKADVSESGKMYFRDAKGQVWTISETKTNIFVIVMKIVLIIAIFVMILLILKTWAKKRQEKKPPEY